MRSARLGGALEAVAWELPGSVLSLIVDLPDLKVFSFRVFRLPCG